MRVLGQLAAKPRQEVDSNFAARPPKQLRSRRSPPPVDRHAPCSRLRTHSFLPRPGETLVRPSFFDVRRLVNDAWTAGRSRAGRGGRCCRLGLRETSA